jgi:hypothetical protein
MIAGNRAFAETGTLFPEFEGEALGVIGCVGAHSMVRFSTDFPPLFASRTSPPQGGRFSAPNLPLCGGNARAAGRGGKSAEVKRQAPSLSRPVSGLIIRIPRDVQGAWSCRMELTYTGCGSPHALSRLFARAGAWGAQVKRAKARRDMAKGTPPAGITTPGCHRPPAPPNAG